MLSRDSSVQKRLFRRDTESHLRFLLFPPVLTARGGDSLQGVVQKVICAVEHCFLTPSLPSGEGNDTPLVLTNTPSFGACLSTVHSHTHRHSNTCIHTPFCCFFFLSGRHTLSFKIRSSDDRTGGVRKSLPEHFWMHFLLASLPVNHSH